MVRLMWRKPIQSGDMGVCWLDILLMRSSRSSFSAHCNLHIRRELRELRHFAALFELDIQMKQACSSPAAVGRRCLYAGKTENRDRPGPWSLCRFIPPVDNKGFCLWGPGFIGLYTQREPLKTHRCSCRQWRHSIEGFATNMIILPIFSRPSKLSFYKQSFLVLCLSKWVLFESQFAMVGMKYE